jgi:hypothetical protein
LIIVKALYGKIEEQDKTRWVILYILNILFQIGFI